MVEVKIIKSEEYQCKSCREIAKYELRVSMLNRQDYAVLRFCKECFQKLQEEMNNVDKG